MFLILRINLFLLQKLGFTVIFLKKNNKLLRKSKISDIQSHLICVETSNVHFFRS